MTSLRSKFVGALVGVVACIGVANAEQVIVYEAPLDSSSRGISADFAVNRELGRAWVDVQVQPDQSGPEPVFVLPVAEKVDGLYYDAARKQVLFRTATGPVVCAEDSGTTLKSTGNCALIASTAQHSVDDGLAVQRQTVATIALDVQATGAAATASE